MMRRAATVLLLTISVCGWAWGTTYKVTTSASGGKGSLRWAINNSNTHAGNDQIIFASGLAGKTISPKSALPELTDPGTSIDGDLNDDGLPDIALDGSKAGDAAGLVLKGSNCKVIGLAIVRFSRQGILLSGVTGCTIRSCHVGVNRAGSEAARNGGHQVQLSLADGNAIGALGTKSRNVIAAGAASDPPKSGIYLSNSDGNQVHNCNIGIARDGTTALTGKAASGIGVSVYSSLPFPPMTTAGDYGSTGNIIGGEQPADRNVFGGMRTGLLVRRSSQNRVINNYFGLGRDGKTVAPINDAGVQLDTGAQENAIGEYIYAQPPRRNVFAGTFIGVYILHATTRENHLDCNTFGATASGTGQRDLTIGVLCAEDAGRQWIGAYLGGLERGNYFCPRHSADVTHGIMLWDGGGDTVIGLNTFGLRPDGQPATPYRHGVTVVEVSPAGGFGIGANRFYGAESAIYCLDTPSCPIRSNEFHDCGTCVELHGSAQADVGNESSALEYGNNQFHSSNEWYVRNQTSNPVKAERNHFPVGFFSEIDEKIWDQLDNPQLGLVDYQPCDVDLPQMGNPPAVTFATALPLESGRAEIAFGLSGAGEVTVQVLNVAGRPVATVMQDRPSEAGLQRVLWNGQSAAGTRAPAGLYLVSITARSTAGSTSRALARVVLGR